MKKAALLLMLLLAVTSMAYAKIPSYVKAGTYEGLAIGRNDYIIVLVTIDKGKMTSIKVDSHYETANFFQLVYPNLTDRMVKEQKASVDVVAGASMSSRGLIDAVKDALTTAGITADDLKKL